jgi:murein DD-endopeptidase MepM/ murein hydrolase activator NlpD
MQRFAKTWMPVIALLAASVACDDLRLPAARRLTPHEAYEKSLREAGLESTALGRDWILAAARALRQPAPVTLPFREEIYFAPDAPDAAGYQLQLRRGERLVVDFATEGAPAPRLFVDLFRAEQDSARTLHHEVAADNAAQALAYEVDREGTYVLRVQPELLRGARVRIAASAGATLAFPVAGRDSRAVKSYWGAARDAGQRSHQGIDVFAPRGTPALAAASGWITAVRTTDIGGNVVWLWDPERRQSLYYAHLDKQLVGVGDRVQVGDTVGLVGNTGNARTTPPHLHFGIYRRGEGPIDPYRWVHAPREEVPRIQADLAALGALRRAGGARVALREGPSASAATLGILAPRTALHVAGASADWYRVILPDRSFGYLPARSLEQVARPLRTERVRLAAAIRDRPAPEAAVVDSLAPGSAVEVLGQFADFRLVRTREGRLGWVDN